MSNQNPEQIARDKIDKQLMACGWWSKIRKTQFTAGIGVTVREYMTEIGASGQSKQDNFVKAELQKWKILNQ